MDNDIVDEPQTSSSSVPYKIDKAIVLGDEPPIKNISTSSKQNKSIQNSDNTHPKSHRSIKIASYEANFSKSRSKSSSKSSSKKIKDYIPERIENKKEEEFKSPSEKLYAYKLKWQLLNEKDPRIPIPDSNDPDELERLYIRGENAYSELNTPGTLMIVIGASYVGLQYLFNKVFKWNVGENFAEDMISVTYYYASLIRKIGTPGLDSINKAVGELHPVVQILIVIVVQTVVYVALYKIMGRSVAVSAQKAVAGTGLFGANPSEEAQDNPVLNAITSLTSGGGIMDVVSAIMGSKASKTDNDPVPLPPNPTGIDENRENPFL